MNDEAILCVGYQKKYIQDIRKDFPDTKIVVIEENTLLPEGADGVELYSGEYQQSFQAIDTATSLAQDINIVAVVPLREYAVPCANDIAERLQLPHIGKIASRCFRDKFVLRETLHRYNTKYFKQPIYKRIMSINDLTSFFNENGETIIKPSNKQSTVGVFKILSHADIEKYYQASLNSDEPGRIVSDRTLLWEYQAEEFIDGTEYSTEIFVSKGKEIAFNSTLKITNSGVCPYEIGHILPLSMIDSRTNEMLRNAAHELIDILRIEDTVIHAEWMIRGNDVYLIEAAGRAPGCFITDLISNSYNISFFKLWIEILKGGKITNMPSEPDTMSCMRWLDPGNGIVHKINNPVDNKINENINLIYKEINVKEGDQVKIENNQTRIGHLIFKAKPYLGLMKDINLYTESIVLMRGTNL